MRAKIMLLPGSAPGEKLRGYAERLLTEVSAAFNHSFSLMREKIGEKSLAAYQEVLTDETVEACRKCQAVLLCDAECPGAEDLYDALNLPVRIRSFCVPDALCGRHEAPVSLWVGQMLSVDPETLRQGMRASFRFAQEADARVTLVPPSGASKNEWDAAARVQAVDFPQVSSAVLPAPEAVTALIAAPTRLGLLLCPPYAGGILHAAATALCAQPAMMHDLAFDDAIGVYAPVIPKDLAVDEELNPFATALSVAKLLRYSLGLSREAGCVEAAVTNVLAASWRTPDAARPGDPRVGTQAVVELICTQIAVAGELMGKGGFA